MKKEEATMAPNPPASAQNRRRRFLINPRFQLTIIGFSVGLAAFAIGVLILENLYISSTLMSGEYADFIRDSALMAIIEEDRAKVRIGLILGSVMIVGFLFYGGLVLSNRVAGPLYRLEKHMRAIIDGQAVNEFHPRDKDFFPELSHTYNELLRRLSQK